MPASKDYYQLLGVSKDASTADIKKAYRKLAHKYHPDKGGTKEDEQKFREVNEAYQVLSDSTKRKQYDSFGAAGPGGPGFGGQSGQGFEGFGGQDFGFGGLGDIFEQFFSGGAQTRTRGPARGADLEVQLSLSFEEAVKGTTRKIKVGRRVTCPTCKGNGAEPGTKIVTCPRCQGSGEIRTTRQTILGAMTQVTACPECRGEGKKPEKPCHACAGEGRVQQTEEISVDIPAGIDDGQTVRVPGQGESGERGAPPGQLYVTVRVAPSDIFKRDGADVHITAPISYPRAVLGGKIEVPTLTGQATVTVPAGTSSGQTFRLKGEGITKVAGKGKGDQFVTVEIVVPKKLRKEEKEAIERLAEASGDNIKAKGRRFGKFGL